MVSRNDGTIDQQPRPSIQKGLQLRARRRLKAAADEFRRLTELEPENANAWYYLAVTLDNRGCEADAIPCYRRAIELDPNLPSLFQAWLYLASSLRKVGRSNEASDALEKAKEFNITHELIGKIDRLLQRQRHKDPLKY